MDLRRTMTAAIVTVAILAIAAAAALIGLTTVPHAATLRATRSAQSVRTAEGMQRNLLLHDRIRDRTARGEIGGRMREQIARLRTNATTQTELDALDKAESAISGYLAADEALVDGQARAPEAHARAFTSLEKLVAVEQSEAQRASQAVERFDSVADGIGATIAIVVVSAAAIIVWWLHTRALNPLFDLASKMRSFGQGSVDVRALEEGPAEVAEMARRFNEMADAISRQRKERQTFIAGVVHDLRNPLSVLRMSTDVVAREDATLPPERMKKILGAVSRQVDRLDRMVGDLLDSVSIEAGNLRLRLEQHDAREIATEVTELYAPVSSVHTIELDVPEDSVPLRCDAMRVEQVLSNLVSNAIKYSPKGGKVSLKVETSPKEVLFVVKDEGLGMNDEDAAKAFEPFRRSPKHQDEVAGSGLGLFVVRRLVEAHGGSISLRTSLGTGSTFEVRLPSLGSAPLAAR
jgi:two-component system sensor histidine kinase MtrB